MLGIPAALAGALLKNGATLAKEPALVEVGHGVPLVTDLCRDLIKPVPALRHPLVAAIGQIVAERSPGPHAHGWDSANSTNRRTNATCEVIVVVPSIRDCC